jgi:hypothetical protein
VKQIKPPTESQQNVKKQNSPSESFWFQSLFPSQDNDDEPIGSQKNGKPDEEPTVLSNIFDSILASSEDDRLVQKETNIAEENKESVATPSTDQLISLIEKLLGKKDGLEENQKSQKKEIPEKISVPEQQNTVVNQEPKKDKSKQIPIIKKVFRSLSNR